MRVTLMAVRVPRARPSDVFVRRNDPRGVESGHLHGLGSRAQAGRLGGRARRRGRRAGDLRGAAPGLPGDRPRPPRARRLGDERAGTARRSAQPADRGARRRRGHRVERRRRVPGRRRRLPARRERRVARARSTPRSRRSPSASTCRSARASPTAATCSRSSRRRASSGPRPPAETSRSTQAAPIPIAELGADARVAVSDRGTVFATSAADDELVRIDAGGGEPAVSALPKLGAHQLAAVGERAVVFDEDRNVVDGRRTRRAAPRGGPEAPAVERRARRGLRRRSVGAHGRAARRRRCAGDRERRRRGARPRRGRGGRAGLGRRLRARGVGDVVDLPRRVRRQRAVLAVDRRSPRRARGSSSA